MLEIANHKKSMRELIICDFLIPEFTIYMQRKAKIGNDS